MFKLLFVKQTGSTWVLLFRYGFVAVAAFTVDFGGLIILTELVKLNYLLSATLSFCCGVVVNFYLSTGWIFKNSRLARQHHEFAAVFAIAAVGLAINDLILWTLTSKLSLFYLYSKLVATAIVFFWNFFVRKNLLYD